MDRRMTMPTARICTVWCVLFSVILTTACEQQATAEPPAKVMAAVEKESEPIAPTTGGGGDFSMTVVDVFAITGKGVVITGKVSSGSIGVNETVCVPLNSGEAVARTVIGIEQFRKILDRIGAGENGGILVEGVDRAEIKKGANLDTDCL